MGAMHSDGVGIPLERFFFLLFQIRHEFPKESLILGNRIDLDVLLKLSLPGLSHDYVYSQRIQGRHPGYP